MITGESDISAGDNVFSNTLSQHNVRALRALGDSLLSAVQFANGYGAGNVMPAVSLSSATATQVASASVNRQSLLFQNVSSGSSQGVNILIYPQTDINGTAITPTIASPGGGFLLTPQSYVLFYGPSGACQKAWSALSSSGTGNYLTVMAV